MITNPLILLEFGRQSVCLGFPNQGLLTGCSLYMLVMDNILLFVSIHGCLSRGFICNCVCHITCRDFLKSRQYSDCLSLSITGMLLSSICNTVCLIAYHNFLNSGQ